MRNQVNADFGRYFVQPVQARNALLEAQREQPKNAFAANRYQQDLNYKPQNELGFKIAETAQAIGIDPVDLATAISYETGGTFDPKQPGPTTQWGQHRGLIQFGEPQAREYGVDWSDPVNSQLGSDGAVAKYLRSRGVRAGHGLLDVYSAINAGQVGLYDRTDENNGGAPGTVREKVEQQMAGHRKNALRLLGLM